MPATAIGCDTIGVMPFGTFPNLASRASEQPPARWQYPWVWLVVVTGIGAAIRWRAMLNDLWLDEILSLRLLDDVSVASEILTRIHHDNNHPLNSLFLFLLRPQEQEWMYRLLAWSCGTATVLVVGLLAQLQYRQLHPSESATDAKRAGVLTAILFGQCYFMVHYSSEARGYAPALFFVAVAMCARFIGRQRDSRLTRMIYWMATLLGLSAHVAVQQLVIGCSAWAWLAAQSPRTPLSGRLLTWARWEAVPFAALGAFWFFFVRHLTVAGGSDDSLWIALGDLAAFNLGLPVEIGAIVGIPFLVLLLVAALRVIGTKDAGLAVFYVTGIFVTPMFGLAATRFSIIFPRYFIVSAALALLLVGYLLARAYATGRASRIVCLMCVASFVIGNGIHTLRLYASGRGQYRLALQDITSGDSSSAIAVSGDHDFRNGLVITHHAMQLPSGRTVRYHPNVVAPPGGIQFWFAHRLDHETQPPPSSLRDADNNLFVLRKTYPHGALSGWDWDVYERVR